MLFLERADIVQEGDCLVADAPRNDRGERIRNND